MEAIYSSIAKEGYYHDLYYEDGTYLWGGNANNIKDGDVVIVQYTPNQNKIYVCLEDGTLKGWFNGYTDEDISKYSSNFKKTDCTVKFFDEEGNEVSKVPPKECTLIVKYFRNFKVSINIYDTEESKPIKSYTLNGYEGTSVTFNKNNYKIDGKRIWKTTINGKEFFEDELTFSEDASIFLNVCSDTIEGVYKWCGLDCVIDENGVCTISGSLMETPSSQYGANNYMYNAPYAKYGVKKIVGSFDNPNSVDTTSLFRGLKDVREIELNNVVFCGKLDYTFALCDYLTTITIQNIEFRNIESCDYMFYSDKYLKTINISNSSGEFLLGKFSGIFSGDIRLEKINLGENAVIPNSFTGNNAFGSCVNLKEINSILDNGNTTTNITLPGEFKKYTYDSANDTYTYQGTTNVLEKGFVLKREDGKTEATINAYDYDTKEFLCSFEALPGDYFSSFKKNLPDEYIADKWTNMDGFRAINNLKYYIEDSSSEDGLKSVDKIPANIYGQTLKIYVKKRPYVDINLYNGDNNKHIVSTYNVVAGDNYFNTVKSYANKVYSDGATWITVDKDGNEWDYIIPNQTSTYYVKYTHPVVKITVKDEEGNILGSIDSYEKKGIDRTPFIKKGYYLNYYDEDGNYISTTPLTDITVIAKYTANTYYFNLYGVDNKFVKGLSTKSDDILKLSSLEKEGYYFKIFERDDRANPNETKVEYDIQVDENNEKYIIAPPSDEFNFCATIEYYPTTQELTIKDMDGNLITTISGETNTTIDRTFYNCPDGYTFSIVDSEGNIVTKVPTKDTTLFIKLTPKTFRYTIRYKYWLSTEYNDYIIVTAKVGEKITMSENSWLARNFYLSFVDENGNAITTYPSEACDIYVIQTPKTFTAKIVDDNDNEIVTITKEYLSKVYISDIPEICRDGYVPNIVNDNAGGWILEFDENGEPFFYMTEDNGIYEIERYFLVNNHVIVKDENGNSIFEFDLKLSDWLFSDEPYIVPCPPTIDGCNFIGYKLSDGSVVSPSRLLELSNKWRETGDLSDEEANEAQYIYDGLYEYLYLPEASTIVAVYDRLPFYTVKFENENGDVIKTIEKELNQEVTLIDGPIKAHYSFEGWKVKGTNDILEETTIKKDSPCEVTLVPVYKRLRVVNVYDGTSNKRDTLLYSFDWDGETTIQLKDTVPDELKNDKIRYFGFTDFYGDTDYRKETLYKTNSSSYEFSIWIKSFMYLNRLYFYDKVTGATLFNGYFEVDKDIKDYFIEKEKDFKPHDIKDDFYKVEDESGNEWDYKVPWFKDGDFKVLKYYITYNHPTINITIKINNTNEVVTVLKGIAGTAVDITLLQRQGYKLVHSIPSTFPYEDITTSVQYIPIEQQYTIHRMNSKGIEEYSFKTRKFTNSVISLNGWGKIGYSMRIVDKDDNEISTYPGDCLDIYLKYTPIVQTIDIIDSTGKVLTTIDGTIEDYISINQIDEIKKDGYYCWIDDLSFDYKSFDGTYQSMRFKFPGDGRDINVIYLPIKYNVVVKDENKNSLDTFEVSYTSMYQNEYVLPAPKQINGCNFLGYKDSNGNTLSIDEVERLSKLREDSLTDEEYEFMNQYNNLMMNSFKQENSNVTFIAVYDRLPFYTVKFENEKDDVIKTIETNLAESTNLIDAPTKDGYDFKGWIVKGDEEKKILDKTISSDKVCEITLVPTYAIKQKAPENNKPSEGNNSNTNNNTPSSTTPSSSTPPTSTSTPTIDKKVEPTKDIQKEEVKEEPTRKVDDITKDNKEEVVKPTTNNENIKEETTTPSNENNNTKVEGKETSSVPTVEIHGVIENKEGEYIVDANVVIAKQSTKEIVVKTTTNKKGQYSASLPSGEFEIEITSKEGEIILSREISIPKNVAENEEDFDISVITLSDEQIAKAGFHTLEMEEIEETSNNMQQIIIIILIFIFVILLLVTSFAIKKSLKNKKH